MPTKRIFPLITMLSVVVGAVAFASAGQACVRNLAGTVWNTTYQAVGGGDGGAVIEFSRFQSNKAFLKQNRRSRADGSLRLSQVDRNDQNCITRFEGQWNRFNSGGEFYFTIESRNGTRLQGGYTDGSEGSPFYTWSGQLSR